ncbi:MAG: hypothetical protein KA187_01390, partial [Arenimonas sp.]|nr:hypothetical protein [Arenimonas sp.]
VAIRTARAEGTLQASRTLLRADLAQADSVRHRFNADDAPSFPGTTALGVSTRVLRQLRDSGRSAITLDVGAIAPRATEAGVGLDTELDRQLHAAGGFEGIEEAVNRGVERGELTAGERAQGARTVADIPRLGLATGRLHATGRLQVPVIVNDRPVRLDALTAIGSLSNGRDEVAVSMAILDDPDNPLLLRLQIGDVVSEVTRIGYAQSSITYASQIEQALLKACRVDVYGLGFDPGADQLPPGSDETVAALRRALGRHPDWKVAVLSHDANVPEALSTRRAQAIRDSLAQDDGARVVAVPLPRPAPLASSDTAAGRALNRRTTFSRTGCPQ